MGTVWTLQRMDRGRMTAESALFWIFSACTVGAALLVVSAKSPINSAMSLVATFFFLAGIYVLLLAHTIAIFQVLVYAGAIMVLFLFAIMLLRTEGPGTLTPAFGTIQSIGARLFTDWLLPFEAVSLLLLVAMVGAVMVAKSRVLTAEDAQVAETISLQ